MWQEERASHRVLQRVSVAFSAIFVSRMNAIPGNAKMP
jgi:hypothetical protein